MRDDEIARWYAAQQPSPELVATLRSPRPEPHSPWWTAVMVGIVGLGLAYLFFPRSEPEVAPSIEVVPSPWTEGSYVVRVGHPAELDWDGEVVRSWRQLAPGQQGTALYEVELAADSPANLGTLSLGGTPFPIPNHVLALQQSSAETRLAIASATLTLVLADQSPSWLGPGSLEGLIHGALRPDHPEDEALLALARQLSFGRCTPVHVIAGGQKKSVLVDDQGMPCE